MRSRAGLGWLPAGGRRHGGWRGRRIRECAARLEANGQVAGPGAYCHFRAGEAMHHAAVDQEPCLLVIVIDGPSDVEALDG
jgi:hypothetical protein